MGSRVLNGQTQRLAQIPLGAIGAEAGHDEVRAAAGGRAGDFVRRRRAVGDRPGERQLRADLVAEAGHEHQACLGRDTRDALLVVLPTSNDPSTEGAVGFIGHVVRALMKLAARGVEIARHRVDGPSQVLVRGLEAVVDDGDTDAGPARDEPSVLGMHIGTGHAAALADVLELPLLRIIRIVRTRATIDVSKHRLGQEETGIALQRL